MAFGYLDKPFQNKPTQNSNPVDVLYEILQQLNSIKNNEVFTNVKMIDVGNMTVLHPVTIPLDFQPRKMIVTTAILPIGYEPVGFTELSSPGWINTEFFDGVALSWNLSPPSGMQSPDMLIPVGVTTIDLPVQIGANLTIIPLVKTLTNIVLGKIILLGG